MKKHIKQYSASVEPIAERKMAFTISTAAVDRDGDTIDPKGWDLGAYKSNPVVLWAHDYSRPPLGKAVNLEMTKDGLRADVEFLPAGMDPFADMIHDMVKGGFLNATSVGFKGKDFSRSKDREHGYDFKSQELLEFSIVPVPSNPEALVQRGLDSAQVGKYAKAMRSWANDVLGEAVPKMSDEQFDSLSYEIAKAMKFVPGAAEKKEDLERKQDEKKEKDDGADIRALVAEEVAKALKAQEPQPIIDIQPIESEIDWNSFALEQKKAEFEFDPQQVTEILLASVKEAMHEMAGAQARAAINHMTGRLD